MPDLILNNAASDYLNNLAVVERKVAFYKAIRKLQKNGFYYVPNNDYKDNEKLEKYNRVLETLKADKSRRIQIVEEKSSQTIRVEGLGGESFITLNTKEGSIHIPYNNFKPGVSQAHKEFVADIYNDMAKAIVKGAAWFQNRDPRDISDVYPDIDMLLAKKHPFVGKLLGEVKNRATDPMVTTIGKNGRFLVLTGVRVNEADKPVMVSGGMLTAGDATIARIIDKLVGELIEETYSGDFFAPDSTSAKNLTASIDMINQAFDAMPMSEESKALVAQARASVGKDQTSVSYINALLKTIKDNETPATSETALQMRVQLHKAIYPKEHAELTNFYKNGFGVVKVADAKFEVNGSDGRNSANSCMVTVVLKFKIKNGVKAMAEMEKRAGVKRCDTEESSGNRFRDLVDMVQKPFSNHGAFAIREMAETVAPQFVGDKFDAQNTEEFTPALCQQTNEIRQVIQKDINDMTAELDDPNVKAMFNTQYLNDLAQEMTKLDKHYEALEQRVVTPVQASSSSSSVVRSSTGDFRPDFSTLPVDKTPDNERGAGDYRLQFK